jgi:excisionase family DNA binding protein
MLATMEEEETYSPAEASRVLGRSGRRITERRIRQMLQAGELEGERDEGGRWRIPRRLAERLEAERQRGFWSRLFGG